MEQWGFAVGIPLATLIIGIVALRRQSDKDYIVQLQQQLTEKDRRIDDFKEQLAVERQRNIALVERNGELSREHTDMLRQLLAAATIHKPPTRPNGEGGPSL